MSDGPFFAGVDGGGTKTVVVIVDRLRRERARVRTGSSNAAVVGHEEAASTLRDALVRAAVEANATLPLGGVWLGLAGSDRPEDHHRLRPALVNVAGSIRFSNDAELVLGALPDGVGVALVAGTGSIAIGVDRRGVRARTGGWGHIFSDEGSGYDVTRKMLRAFAREADGRGPATRLTGRLTEHFQLSEPHQIIARVYAPSMTKGGLASLCRIVAEEAEAGDEVAMGIITSTADDLADLGHVVAGRLGFPGGFDLAVTGGLFIHMASFRCQVMRTLGQRWAISTQTIVRDPALTAARALASAGGNHHG
ncbi:MAG: hypothetical protein AVDCRST_MAG87-3525 [uncultured Thermomicrobiales bacterium]|uniref:ATPase BadF/BadG/BcrA/BcrD type domain-containing protein n=1 Tax=uncultured Thermomicrobiales bacterium TaxID=1645740 RepID=A0A6J4VQ07_9BACT|nr:MAG: hypothetical protein AVDCRST_MAG87-3525 [uncultured Thermomicrobiales bacterium]